MNWRVILGLVLLFAGIAELYTVLNNSVKSNPLYAEVGCVVWMLAGTFLVIKGMSKKPE